jgi:hypothetical protein
MYRSLALFLGTALLAAPAAAANYSAKLGAPTSGNVVARDINWKCAGNSCLGSTQESRPAVICQGLAKKAGRLEAFSVDGRPFSSAELDRCNATAKTKGSQALAAQ